MVSLTIPPRETFAGMTRRIIEAHDTWDSPHQFVTLHWDGEKLDIRTLAVIDPAIHPSTYGEVMLKVAREEIGGDRAATLYGFALQIEAFSAAEPGPEATATERAAFTRDRLSRSLHQRPDAIETALAYSADIHGRVWGAIKRRDHDGIEEVFYAPGERASHGQMVDALLTVAILARTTVHGLPVMNPFGGRS